MASPTKKDDNKSVYINSVGGDMKGVALGDNNRITIMEREASLPDAEDVNIKEELVELQAILASFDSHIVSGVAKALEAESKKTNPDKSNVARFLDTGLSYAKDLAEFGGAIEKLRPRVEAVAGWLGEHGTKLLALVGLTA